MGDAGHWVDLVSMSSTIHGKYWPLPVPVGIKAPGMDKHNGNGAYVYLLLSISFHKPIGMTFKLPLHFKYTYHFLVLHSLLAEVLEYEFGSSKWRERGKNYFTSVLLLEPLAGKNFNIFPFISHSGRVIFQILTITRSLKAILILKKKMPVLGYLWTFSYLQVLHGWADWAPIPTAFNSWF